MKTMNSNTVLISTSAEEVMIHALKNIMNLALAPIRGGNRIVEDGAGDILSHTYDATTYFSIVDIEAKNALKLANRLISEASSAYFGDSTGTQNVPMIFTQLEHQLIDVLESVLDFTEAPNKGYVYVGSDVENSMAAHTYTPEFYFLTLGLKVYANLSSLGLLKKGGDMR